MTIARHLYLQGLRRERRRGVLEHDPEDAAPGPHARTAGRAELDAVLADLQALPEPVRDAPALAVCAVAAAAALWTGFAVTTTRLRVTGL